MLVGVWDELVEQLIGPDQLDDALRGQERDEAFLPVVVAAFDFAFGVGRGLRLVMPILNRSSRSFTRSIPGTAGNLS